MEKILQQLYEGKLHPELDYIPRSEEYRKLRREHRHNYEDFTAHLNELEPQSAQRFIEILDEQLDLFPLEFSQMFIDGFCLGVKMIMEVYNNNITKDE